MLDLSKILDFILWTAEPGHPAAVSWLGLYRVIPEPFFVLILCLGVFFPHRFTVALLEHADTCTC